MLIYHPAYDAYHCVFRLLLVVDSLRSVELTKLRILDFFLTFPAEIRTVKLPREHMDARKIAQQLVNEYRGPVNAKKTFQDMEQIYLAAVRALAASNLLDKEKIIAGMAVRTDAKIPPEMQEKLNFARYRGGQIFEHILFGLGSIPTQGVDGLKHRTGLLEYRYDVI